MRMRKMMEAMKERRAHLVIGVFDLHEHPQALSGRHVLLPLLIVQLRPVVPYRRQIQIRKVLPLTAARGSKLNTLRLNPEEEEEEEALPPKLFPWQSDMAPGWKGNLSERPLASCAALLVLLPCAALAVYFLLLQTFVLRLESRCSALGTQQEVGEEGQAPRLRATGAADERPLTSAPPATRGRRVEFERRQIRWFPVRRDVKEKFPSGPPEPDRSTCGFTQVTTRFVRGVSESSRPEAHGSGEQTHPMGEGLVLPAPPRCVIRTNLLIGICGQDIHLQVRMDRQNRNEAPPANQKRSCLTSGRRRGFQEAGLPGDRASRRRGFQEVGLPGGGASRRRGFQVTGGRRLLLSWLTEQNMMTYFVCSDE
ncbi:Transmembrane protein 216 [Liparis tanakae]|uniref:Transmembrane protein 216 n=1 Tax=Liparis tanakae TaxID=230148 RepID=A0A4Z2I2J0_9TELE|nr:Transmembrane protein 216 [Liparis tanakae]